MIKISGYVICAPINTWGDETKSPWHPHEHTFGKTPHESWIRFFSSRPEDDDSFDRKRNHYVGSGYCVKKADLSIDL